MTQPLGSVLNGGWLPAAVNRLLLPATDVGVLLQLAIILGTVAVAWNLTSGRRHWRPAVIGIALLLLGAVGLRAAH